MSATWLEETQRLIADTKQKEEATERELERAQARLVEIRAARAALEAALKYAEGETPDKPQPPETPVPEESKPAELPEQPAQHEKAAETANSIGSHSPNDQDANALALMPRGATEAHKRGLKRYLGELCKRGHNHQSSGRSLRYTSTNTCLECGQILSRALYEKKHAAKIIPAPPKPAEESPYVLGPLYKRGHDNGSGFSMRYRTTNWCVQCQKDSDQARKQERPSRPEAPGGGTVGFQPVAAKDVRRAGVKCPRCKNGQAFRQRDELFGGYELKCTACGHVLATYGKDGKAWEPPVDDKAPGNYARGESSPASKLTEREVGAIRQEHDYSRRTTALGKTARRKA